MELSRVHDVTSETKIAQMRMKFWEGAVDAIYKDSENGSVPDHPVVNQLHKVCLKLLYKKITINVPVLISRWYKTQRSPSTT